MKITMHVCDICKKKSPNARIKYKYRAKKFWCLWDDTGWDRIELCQDCLDKIIKAKGYAEAKNYLLHCIDEAKSKDWASGIKFALATIEKAIEANKGVEE